MSDKLYFCNDGEFNPTAMLTFGVSAKEKDNAIGKFGTGFKYAVAVILRLGGSIKVYSKDKEYVFNTTEEEIRGKSFNVVYMNGQNAGFTTHFWINWEPWMAFRELYCNMKDEDGDLFLDESIEEHTSWDTIIEVECNELVDVFEDKDDYFLSSKPFFKNDVIEVHDNPTDKVYYQDVLVGHLDSPSRYTYNILSKIDLTEERIYRYSFQIEEAIGECVQKLLDRSKLRELFNHPKAKENEIAYPFYGVSSCYKEVCQELLNTEKGIPENSRWLLKEIAHESGEWPTFELTDMQEMAFNKAVDFLEGIRVPVKDYPINFVTGLGQGVMGRAYEGQIYISEVAFNMGVKQLASTLMEEWVHIKQGCNDFDRIMQNWLFDKILSLGEEINQGVL